MKRHFILFVCVACLCVCAFTTCDVNNQVIAILKDASELAYLNVTAYFDGFPLTGGASLSPSLSSSVFEYTLYVSKDANSVSFDAGVEGDGTVVCTDEIEGIEATEFAYVGDQPMVITITAQREYMNTATYQITVVRMDFVPTAEDVSMSVNPSIGAFFLGSNVIPSLAVHARPPAAGGELTYQWYFNLENNNLSGLPINGATGTTYTMPEAMTKTERTVYYYVEITNTLDGNSNLTKSNPRPVSFINKHNLHPKSLAMVEIPPGEITNPGTGANQIRWGFETSSNYPYLFPRQNWSTPGFLMGANVVTWELWETVMNFADAGGYRFGNAGNQGAEDTTDIFLEYLKPVGNRLNPVTMITWRDAVVWCNAYSEMDGLDAVYLDQYGNVLTDSRKPVDLLVDSARVAGKNGYRLPTSSEWYYAAKGAYPRPVSDTTAVWNQPYMGAANGTDGDYFWSKSPDAESWDGIRATGEVGQKRPNKIWSGNGDVFLDGLYDMMGMVYQYIWSPKTDISPGQFDSYPLQMGTDINENIDSLNILTFGNSAKWLRYSVYMDIPYNDDGYWVGFRVVRSK